MRNANNSALPSHTAGCIQAGCPEQLAERIVPTVQFVVGTEVLVHFESLDLAQCLPNCYRKKRMMVKVVSVQGTQLAYQIIYLYNFYE